ncbi:hypothetical protein J2S97_003717 [Arthrobacter oryzae]|nr:hypothetical protein [Arthrobacter oryzae]MDQ0078518.1 hypothetical protein [Arthrobacter oryzae]
MFPRTFGPGVIAFVAMVVVALVGATAASAYWPASGTGSTTAAVATLAPPTNVTVPATSASNVPVSWTESMGTPASAGYYVTRVTGATSMLACGSGPAALIAGTGCTDTSVPEGTHQYVVTAVHLSWTASSIASGNVTVDNRDTINFIVQPGASVTAGSPVQSVTVELRTALGLKLLLAGAEVSIGIGNNPAGGSLSGTLTATTNIWGEATFAGLSLNKADTGYTLIASRPGYSGGVSTPFTVTAAAATQLMVTGPAWGTASATATFGPFTVQRQDAYGNPVTTGSTDVALASNSTGAKVFALTTGGATVASVTIPAGASSASFYYGDTKAGSASLIFNATGLSAAPKPVTVSAASAASLVFSPTLITAEKNKAISPAVLVMAADAFGNPAEAAVTIHSSSNCKNLKGNETPAIAVGGTATFSALMFNGKASACILTATFALLSADSNTFEVP